MTLRHLPGQHPQQSHAGGLDFDAMTRLYGDVYDEASVGDLSVVVFQGGDLGIFIDTDDDHRQPFLDGLEANSARDLADALQQASTVDIPDDAERDPKYGLVDWIDVTDEVIVGWDHVGDVSIVLPDEGERVDVGADEAQDLAGALERMADRYDELDPVMERSNLRHLPGAHDQDSHGGGRHAVRGMPAKVWSKIHNVAGGRLEISAEAAMPGRATLRVQGHTARLDRGQVWHLRRLYFQSLEGSPVRITEAKEVKNAEGKVIAADLIEVLSLTPVGAKNDDGMVQEFDLRVGPNVDEDGEPVDRAPIRVTAADLDPDRADSAYTALFAATSARRMETGYGPLDVYPAGDARLGLRMKDDDGDATDVEFTAADYERINAATNYLIDGFDEDSDDEINELTVKTSDGPVRMRWRGERLDRGYHPDARLVMEPEYAAAWSVVIGGDHLAAALQSIDDTAAAAGIETDTFRPIPVKKLNRGYDSDGEVRRLTPTGRSGLSYRQILDDGALRLRGILTPSPDLRHLPGKHDQKSHGNWSPKNKAAKKARELQEMKEALEKAAAEEAALKAQKVAEAAAAASENQYARPTSTPTRMTKGQYTKILKDEHIRLQILDGKSEKEAKALARPAATIDELKNRNRDLRNRLRAKGVDHRTEEQRNTDDAEKNQLLDEVQRLASAGGHDGAAKRAAASKMTVPELRKFVRDVTDYQKQQAEKEKQARIASQDAAAREEYERQRLSRPATDRQVDYIMNLLSRHAGGGFFNGPKDRAGVKKLTQGEASAYINSLTDNY